MTETKQQHESLIVSDVSCVRGGRTVLSGLSVCLGLGEMALITGSNGSGKSTLLRVLAGLLPTSSGNIHYPQGKNVMYQGHAIALKSQWTALQNLNYWLRVLGADDKDSDALAALEAMSLAPLADLPVLYFSEGQKRRLTLARVIATGRHIWLLDEPNVGLDRTSLARLDRVLDAHLKGGGMALVAAHGWAGRTPDQTLTLGDETLVEVA